MKAKLFKKGEDNYILLLNNPKECDYSLPPLSLRNCQAIERGYDLEELIEEEFPYDFDIPLFETLGITEKVQKSILIGMLQGTLIKGFKKALEILGDKKFSEEDVKRAIFNFANYDYKNISELDGRDKAIQSLQQTEWDVEIEMDAIPADRAPNGWDTFPKLDADGCLILKRK